MTDDMPWIADCNGADKCRIVEGLRTRPIAIKGPSSIRMAEVVAQCLKNGDQENVIMFDCEPLIEYLRDTQLAPEALYPKEQE